MNIKSIKTERHYRRVLKEIEGLMNARRNTPAGDRWNVLVALVEAWEAKHYPLGPASWPGSGIGANRRQRATMANGNEHGPERLVLRMLRDLGHKQDMMHDDI